MPVRVAVDLELIPGTLGVRQEEYSPQPSMVHANSHTVLVLGGVMGALIKVAHCIVLKGQMHTNDKEDAAQDILIFP